MRKIKREQFNEKYGHLTPAERKTIKHRRRYATTTIFPAGRYLRAKSGSMVI